MNDETMDSSYTPPHTLEQALVALLFAAREPLSAKEIARIAGVKTPAILSIIEEVNQKWAAANDPLTIEKAGENFVLKTRGSFRPLIDRLYKGPIKERLSKASLEVLAIILHKEPVARSAIDQLRGVDCLPILQSLLDRGLIETETCETKKIPLYRTTKRFFAYFSLPGKEEVCPPSLASSGSLQELKNDP